MFYSYMGTIYIHIYTSLYIGYKLPFTIGLFAQGNENQFKNSTEILSKKDKAVYIHFTLQH
jgi:hypothetical protein